MSEVSLVLKSVTILISTLKEARKSSTKSKYICRTKQYLFVARTCIQLNLLAANN